MNASLPSGANHTGMNLYQLACSVGRGALDSSSLSQHSVPFLIFKEVLFQNLAQTLSSLWIPSICFLDFDQSLFGLYPSLFKVVNQTEGVNAGPALGTEPESHLPHSGNTSIMSHDMTFHSSLLNAFVDCCTA